MRTIDRAVYRNPITGARFVVDTKAGQEALEKALPEMWVKQS